MADMLILSPCALIGRIIWHPKASNHKVTTNSPINHLPFIYWNKTTLRLGFRATLPYRKRDNFDEIRETT